jgi:hypothetical protein
MNLQSITMFAAAASLLSPAALAETRNFDLPAFDEIHVSSGIKAEIVVGGDQSVVVEAEDDDDFDELEISVRNGKLRIGLERSFFESLRDWFSEGPKLTSRISVPALTELEASSGADVDAKGMSGQYLVVGASSGARLAIDEVNGEDVSASASSGARLDASGTCGRIDASVSSGGRLNLARLECEDVSVDASSGGQAEVFASASVDAEASSGGNVDVAGGPNDIEIDTSSGGDIDINN